jgi:hypothetical protein
VVTITHPFSPQKGQELVFIERINAWGEDRILCCDVEGNSRAVLTSWTDYLPEDPFFTISGGKADFKYEDLCMLARLIADIQV